MRMMMSQTGDLMPGIMTLAVRRLLLASQSRSHAAGVFMDLQLIKHPERWTLLLWSSSMRNIRASSHESTRVDKKASHTHTHTHVVYLVLI